ncbi:Aste57867_24332 [Aphanomyces stellatus]|uniref:Aste57867_24332 protein n=1 Tax=Aphanomyces stellatus TaxID=120398 RepID=A0A485LQ28_9STRA|nr:hypothetical protein As57867_024257 [Aphanomyces stellatus]VFU00972.1 Aste57867_24332 [Aphanomyces stellatus]
MHRRPVKGGTGWDCKAEGAKAAGLYFEIANVGKVVEASKKRITWRIKMIEGKEYEISLTHSIASGKKVLRIDGIVTHQTSTFSLGDWDHCFNLGNHVIHIIIKPSVELNDSYDLIVDGISFRRLPEDVIKPKADPVINRGKKSLSREPSASDMSRTDSASGGAGWECTVCTLINDKPFAPICEACGAAKPRVPIARLPSGPVKQPSFELLPSAPGMETVQRVNSKGPVPRRESSTEFNPFGPPPTSSASTWESFDKPSNPGVASSSDPFSPSSAGAFSPQAAAPSSDHIASMLHGLDFNYTPPPQSAAPQSVAEPEPAHPAGPEPTADPLWGAHIVDLNLNPEAKNPPLKSTRSMQSLEQARLATNNGSQKQLVMPPPPVYTAPPTAFQPAYPQAPYSPYGGGGMANPQHIVAPPMQGQFATYNNMQPGLVQPRAPQQQFMSNMTNVPPQPIAKAAGAPRPNLNDPFATLS